MKVPVEAVRRMKRTFSGPVELWRLGKAAGLQFKRPEVERMWKGDFGDVPMRSAEEFWLMVGYRFVFAELGV